MRCNLVEIVVRVSSDNDKPRTRRHTLRVTRAGANELAPIGPTLYKMGGFAPDKSRNYFLHAQTMA